MTNALNEFIAELEQRLAFAREESEAGVSKGAQNLVPVPTNSLPTLYHQLVIYQRLLANPQYQKVLAILGNTLLNAPSAIKALRDIETIVDDRHTLNRANLDEIRGLLASILHP